MISAGSCAVSVLSERLTSDEIMTVLIVKLLTMEVSVVC